MLLHKKSPVILVPARSIKKELEYLYARKSALDELIQSLESYERFRSRHPDPDKRRSA
jgi:hypothetical protein